MRNTASVKNHPPLYHQQADLVAQARRTCVQDTLAPRRTRPVRAAAPAPAPTAQLPEPEPMRSIDTVFLHLGNFVCTGLLTFAGPVRRNQVLKMVNTKLLTMARFQQRVVTTPTGAPAWQLDPQFAAGRHVRQHTCRGGAHSPELMALTELMMDKPLDTTRPLWDMAIIHCSDNKSVLLVRVHHAVADGMRLMQAVLQCDDDPARLERMQAQLRAAATQAQAARRTGMLGAVASWAGTAARLGNSAWMVAQLALRRADPPTSLKHAAAVDSAWAGSMPTWPVDEVKALAQALSPGQAHGTVNDVLLSLLTGALRRVLQQRGDAVDGLTLHCLQAVNMLASGAAVNLENNLGNSLGNNVGSATVPLPIYARTPQARFNACQATNRALKASTEPALSAALMGCMGALPADRLRTLFMRTSSQATCAMSNIKGPTEKLHLCGQEVQDMRWYVAPIGNIGIFAPVISYDGQLRMCLQVDKKLNLGIATLKQAMDSEWAELKAAAAHA